MRLKALLCALLFVSCNTNLFASDQKFVAGAGTLASGKIAFTTDIGNSNRPINGGGKVGLTYCF